MRKLLIAIVVSLVFTVGAIAQDAPANIPKQKSVEELTWQAMYLQEHIKTLQADFQRTQDMLKQVQDELKARQPAAPPTKQPEPPKDDKKGKK